MPAANVCVNNATPFESDNVTTRNALGNDAALVSPLPAVGVNVNGEPLPNFKQWKDTTPAEVNVLIRYSPVGQRPPAL